MYSLLSIRDCEHLPATIRAKASVKMAPVVDYLINNYTGTITVKRSSVDIINAVSYRIISGDAIPKDWNPADPYQNNDWMDGDAEVYYGTDDGLTVYDIDWSELVIVDPVVPDTVESYVKSDPVPHLVNLVSQAADDLEDLNVTSSFVNVPPDPGVLSPEARSSNRSMSTDMRHIALAVQSIPRPSTKVWMSGYDGNNYLTIYSSLPEIPECQRHVSISTDINRMTVPNLLRLFPETFVPPRPNVFYQEYPGMEYDPVLGVIMPIEGFTSAQLRDNILRYPQIYGMNRDGDGHKWATLYGRMEVDGKLVDVKSNWEDMEASKVIPKKTEFVKEYVARRYLLERDYKTVEHKYPIHGTYTPFLVLFNTPEYYASCGYKDPVDLARQCVSGRVNFWITRNPVIRQLDEYATRIKAEQAKEREERAAAKEQAALAAELALTGQDDMAMADLVEVTDFTEVVE